MPAHTYYIELSNDDRDYLKSLVKTRTIQAQVVDRARILLWKSESQSDKTIADNLGILKNLKCYLFSNNLNMVLVHQIINS